MQALEEESTMTPEQLALKNVGKQVCVQNQATGLCTYMCMLISERVCVQKCMCVFMFQCTISIVY